MESYSQSSDEKLLASLCHISALFAPILLPLIVYLLKRDSSFVKDHAKEALMFHIGMAIAETISAILVIILIGVLLIPLFFIIYVICTILAVVRAWNGEPFHYPVTTHFARKL